MADLAESADKDERHSRYCLLFVFTATELGGGGGEALSKAEEPGESAHLSERRS